MDVNPGRTLSPTKKVAGPARLGLRRLARAHLALGERPRAARLGADALRGVTEVLARELGSPVTGTGRLLDAVVVPEKGLGQGVVFVLLELSAVGGTAVLELEPPLVFAALERLAGAGRRTGPVAELTRLEESTLVYLVLLALAVVRAQGELHRGLGPRLTGVTMRRAEALSRLEGPQLHVAVELSLSVGDTSSGARLLVPARMLQAAVRELPVEREPSRAPELLAAELEAWCLVGRSPLPPAALESLSVGDVVVFEGVRREGGGLLGPGRLVTRGFALAGDFLSEGFSLTRAQGCAPSQESDMVAVNERSEGMPPLPVDVEIELARVLLPLSELVGLKPGALLPLHINASDPVLLRVGTRAVARAELVEIEGEIGARILALLP